ncbi:hypothetical protein ABZ299_35780, partial [Streptomyces sp. NPDC006184]|uniref:hypothetical protein n=1 Tax=Streptomyces sp. NPDC006184 TaxID=3155455 RepID=UPI0033B15F1D
MHGRTLVRPARVAGRGAGLGLRPPRRLSRRPTPSRGVGGAARPQTSGPRAGAGPWRTAWSARSPRGKKSTWNFGGDYENLAGRTVSVGAGTNQEKIL